MSHSKLIKDAARLDKEIKKLNDRGEQILKGRIEQLKNMHYSNVLIRTKQVEDALAKTLAESIKNVELQHANEIISKIKVKTLIEERIDILTNRTSASLEEYVVSIENNMAAQTKQIESLKNDLVTEQNKAAEFHHKLVQIHEFIEQSAVMYNNGRSKYTIVLRHAHIRDIIELCSTFAVVDKDVRTTPFIEHKHKYERKQHK